MSKSAWDRRPSSLSSFNCSIASSYTLLSVYTFTLLVNRQSTSEMVGFGDDTTSDPASYVVRLDQPCCLKDSNCSNTQYI
jgi:hypothetical protein